MMVSIGGTCILICKNFSSDVLQKGSPYTQFRKKDPKPKMCFFNLECQFRENISPSHRIGLTIALELKKILCSPLIFDEPLKLCTPLFTLTKSLFLCKTVIVTVTVFQFPFSSLSNISPSSWTNQNLFAPFLSYWLKVFLSYLHS